MRTPHEEELTDMRQVYLTVGDAAKVLQVTPAAVRLMAERGDLLPAAETEGGIRLFRRLDVERLKRRREEASHGR